MSLYKILAIPKEAGASEIRAAYQKAIKSAHPDHGGSNEKFQQVKNAFEVLIDPVARSKYDLNGNIDGHKMVYIVTDEVLHQCRARFRESESELQAIRHAYMVHRGSIVKLLKDVPFLWSNYTDRYDSERQRVEGIIKGILHKLQ